MKTRSTQSFNLYDFEEENENTLAEQLKTICDDEHKELDLELSAKILYEIGLIYKKKKQPLKISLIKCAGLLNAALTREPENAQQIQNSLIELCSNILHKANAHTKADDLIEFSKSVKSAFADLRKYIKSKLENIIQITEKLNESNLKLQEETKIYQVQLLQEYITNVYKRNMADISEYCEKIMGRPKCKYAIVGMGSIARMEITPYSDFEHMILLEDGCQNRDDYQSILEYFRWFSVIFHIILINLQETIVPNLAVQSLNYKIPDNPEWFYDDYTTRGVSFDSINATACKFPLGNQHYSEESLHYELIKPISEMLKYATDPKYLDHFKDILLTTCYISGNRDVYDYYKIVIDKHIEDLSKTKQCLNEREKLLEADFYKFGTRNKLADLKQIPEFNLKKVIYRSTTLFISHLAKINNVSSTSCFDMLDDLAEKQIITVYTRHKLSYAVAIACEIRLKVYIEKESQEEFIKNVDVNDEEKASFYKYVGKKSLLNYFQIAYTLQCMITLKYFYDKPFLLNISICWFFNLKNECILLIEMLENNLNKQLQFAGFEQSLKRLENETPFVYEPNQKVCIGKVNDSFENVSETDLKEENIRKSLYKITIYFYSINMLDITIEYGRRFFFIETSHSDKTLDALWIYKVIGYSLMAQKKYSEAYDNLKNSLDLNKRAEHVEVAVASAYNLIGNELKQASPSKSTFVYSCLDSLHAKKSNLLTTYFHYVLNTSMQKCFEYFGGHGCSYLIGSKLEEKSETLSERLLIITKSIPSTHLKIGICLFYQKRVEDSKTHFSLCLESKQVVDNDVIIEACTYMGHILWITQQYKKALIYYEKSAHKQLKNIFNYDVRKYIEINIDDKARILNLSNKNEDALEYFKCLLSFQVRMNESKRNSINAKSNIAMCLREIGKTDEAITKLKEALDEAEKISLFPDKDKLIADIYESLGNCYNYVNNPKDELNCYKRALNILIKSRESHKIILLFYNQIQLFHALGRLYNNICNNEAKLENINYVEQLSYYKISLDYLKKALDLCDSLIITEQSDASDCASLSQLEIEKHQENKIKDLNKQRVERDLKIPENNFRRVEMKRFLLATYSSLWGTHTATLNNDFLDSSTWETSESDTSTENSDVSSFDTESSTSDSSFMLKNLFSLNEDGSDSNF